VDQAKRGLVELCANISAVENLLTEKREEVCSSSKQSAVNLLSLDDWTEKLPTSLPSFVVFAEKPSIMGTQNVVRMLREAAVALFEVHKLGFIHRDIAPRNILCDANGNIQLADFGLAKYVGSTGNDDAVLNYYKKKYFTPGHQYALAWWAPECFGCEEEYGQEGEDGVFSWNSDVYAFGTTMWQCFAHRDPFSYVLKKAQNQEDAVKCIERLIIEGERPKGKKPAVLDSETPDALIDLMVSCWNTKPDDRPTLINIINDLRQLEEDLKNGPVHPKAVISNKQSHQKHWHDVRSMYQGLRPPNVLAGHMAGGTFLEIVYRNVQQVHSHKQAPLDCIPQSLKAEFKYLPYDVFLIHAGEQKESADLPSSQVTIMQTYRPPLVTHHIVHGAFVAGHICMQRTFMADDTL
jgi:serine/threonine protein kinase